jgi:hypothetical protein
VFRSGFFELSLMTTRFLLDHNGHFDVQMKALWSAL